MLRTTAMLLTALVAASAQAQTLATNQISINLTGQGSGDLTTGFGLTGSGTMSPFGNMTLVIVGSPGTISAIPMKFTFTFSDGDTLVATSFGQGAPDEISGSASVAGGTGQFQAATGSFQYTLIAPPGTTSANVQYTMAGSGSVTSAATGAVQLSPGSLSFSATAGGGSPAAQTVTVLSASGAQVAFTVTTDGGQASIPAPSWLQVSPLAGTTPGVLTVSVNPSALSAGSYSARILVNGMAAAVNLTVATAPPQLSVAPAFLRYAARAQSPGLLDQAIVVRNAGGSGTLSFSVSSSSPIPWLDSITPASGQASASNPALVDVRINTNGLAVGGYKGVIQVASGSTVIDVPISVFVSASGAILNVDQTGVLFTLQQGQTTGPTNTVDVLNAGDPGSTVNFSASVVNSAKWLAVSPATGTATTSQPGMVQLTVNASAQDLVPGGYYALVQIADANSHNSPQFVVVVLNVAPITTPVAPNPTPQGLVFTKAGSQPIALSVSGNSPVNFAASAITTDGGTWLTVSPATGSLSSANPLNLGVMVNPAGLKAGVYTGLVNIVIGSQVRGDNITLIVPAGAGAAAVPQSAAATSSCTPTRTVLTQTGITTNFNVPAGWPASLEIMMFDDCGKPLSTGSVFASFTNGDPSLSMHPDALGVFSATWQPAHPTGGVTITFRGSSGTLQASSIQVNGGVTPNVAPVLYPSGTINNYYAASALSPGLIAQVYGSGMAAAPGQPSSLPLPGAFEGTSVTIGSELAPIYYVSSGQINIQLPTDLTTGQQVIIVSANGALTLPDLLDINPFQAGIAAYTDGSNNVIAQHADYSYITAAHPANPGEVVIIYLAGMGATNPAVPSGQAAPSMEPLARVFNMPTVTVDGQNAAVSFAGLAPGFVGLYQVDFQVPANARTGSLPLVVSQGGVAGNTTNLVVGQ